MYYKYLRRWLFRGLAPLSLEKTADYNNDVVGAEQEVLTIRRRFTCDGVGFIHGGRTRRLTGGKRELYICDGTNCGESI